MIKKIIVYVHVHIIYYIYNFTTIITLLLYYLLLSLKFIFLNLGQGSARRAFIRRDLLRPVVSPARDSRVICENLDMRPRVRTEICPRSDLSFAAKWGQLETRTSAASLPHSAEIYSVGLIEADRSDDVTDRQRGTTTFPQGVALLSEIARHFITRKREREIFLDSKIKLFIDAS